MLRCEHKKKPLKETNDAIFLMSTLESRLFFGQVHDNFIWRAYVAKNANILQ